MKNNLNIISWNVNGIRAVVKKGFRDFLSKYQPDILCLQEIKISEEALKKHSGKFSAEGGPASGWDFVAYQEFWNPATRPGYSGTACLVKNNLPVERLPDLSWDDEGRILILDLGKYYLANIYFPNANNELSRMDFKMDFNDKLLKHLKKLETKKPVIVTGDFNVAHQEIDLARPKENIGSAGFTQEERDWMEKFLKAGFKDTFRELHPETIKYSWWSYRAGARSRNVGWRIDYFCVSNKALKNIKKAYILNEILGSDHCPVGIELS
ncbi:exodeoxyribonuclease III [Candidatus Nomurabacteria bacterium]|nr:exodeoxyribonuclease III [Candidatus Nomurabacteria bacterium]